jgi:hypothetical protein
VVVSQTTSAGYKTNVLFREPAAVALPGSYAKGELAYFVLEFFNMQAESQNQ